ncbi:MAG TPA: DUF4352 domain-containing protein [bacterium]|nr:DUF4352 domain-containing protein [bacterium]
MLITRYRQISSLIFFVLFFGLFSSTAFAKELPVSTSPETKYIYRFWSPVFKGHFYTIDYDEADQVANNDSNWNFEMVGFSAYNFQAENTLPVYRFWSPAFKGHFYTINPEEWMRVKDTDANWNYEWVGFYAYPASYTGDARTVYRFWSPVFHHHFYTIDEEEMQRVRDTDSNWTYEGVAFKVPLDDTNIANQGAEDELIESDDVALQIDEISDQTSNNADQVEAGSKLIAAKIYLLNNSDQTLDYDILDFQLIDKASGLSCPAAAIVQPAIASGTLAAGDSIEGYLSFVVPADVDEFVLEYQSDTMNEKNNRIDISINTTSSVIILSDELVDESFSGKKIVGKVKNNTSSPVRYVKLTANFYDSDMNVISTNFAYAENADIDFLNPGETADFTVWYDNENTTVAYYDLAINWTNN